MPEGTATPAPAAQDQHPTPNAPTEPTQSATTGDATGPNGGDEPRFTQADVNRLLARERQSERERADRQAQKDREAAEAKRLEENQEFQKLAEQRQTRIAELEPEVEKAKRYEAALNALLAEEMKQVPEYLHSVLERLDAAERLEWIAAHRAELSAKAQPTANGTPPPAPVTATPRPTNGSTVLDAERERLRRETERRARMGH